MILKLTQEPGAIATAARIARGELSPLEAVDAAIARIERLDGQVNAVVVRDFDRARAAARAMDGQHPRVDQPLFGVPMTIKEAFDIEGLPTTWGLEEYSGLIAKRDASVVRRLKAAGAIIVGKTNVPPLLADWQSENPVYGRTHNPHARDHSPGGSSGGSAAALALGMVAAEYGSDIGGSIRVPSHFSGVWGHKTTWGLVDQEGHEYPGTDGHGLALGVVGPLARDPDDLALLLNLTADRPLLHRERPVEAWRVLYIGDHPVCPVDAEVRGPVEAAVAAIETAGAQVHRASDLVPDLVQQHGEYMRMLMIAMAKGAPGPDGQRASAADWFELLDAQARNQRAWRRLFEAYDFVLAPPAPIVAHPYDARSMLERTGAINGADVPYGAFLAWAGIFTYPGLPSTVLPVGSSHGKPVGMQVAGPAFADLDTIKAAKAISCLLR